MFYTIPPSLDAEIDELEKLVAQFQSGRLEAVAFKARRVPFGVYEQRKDNTYMIRVRCPGGVITPAQLRVVAELAKAKAADTLHITTRQELQIHDVSLENIVPIIRRLRSVNLATRGGGGNTVRNITASFDAGASLDETFDVLPYVFALTNRLIGEPDSWLLPRKYKIAFSNNSSDNARAVFNDLGFVAIERDGRKGFAVYVAGGLGNKPQVGHLLHEFVELSEVYLVAEAIKKLFGRHGNRKNRHAARLRFLWNSLGPEKFKELYQQEVDELRREGLPRLTLLTEPKEAPLPDIISRPDTSEGFELWRRRFVTPQKQPGLFSVLVPIFLGNILNDHALALADFLAPFGEDVLRATIEQNFFFRNIPEAYLGNVFAFIKTIAPLAMEPRLIAASVACTGASTCKLGVCLPRGALTAITSRLRESNIKLDQLPDFKLSLSGCPNTCGAHMTADLGFFGKVARQGQDLYPAYGIVAGARSGLGEARLAEPVGEVSAKDLPRFVAEFLELYLREKSRWSSFANYFEETGRQQLRALAGKFQNVPSFDDDKNYYYDWGAREVFTLAGRGLAECSAGLFDLIELDLNQIQRLREELKQMVSGTARAQAIFEITLSACRMLLITRDAEAHSDQEVFNLFQRHFIESRLVETGYAPLLEIAKAKDLARIEGHVDAALSLAAKMEELYRAMDNSLRFPSENNTAPAAAKTTDAAQPSLVEKDLRGVLCPMNFVKTKLALESLEIGQRLRILLDDGAPIQNVPGSVAGEGHRIIEKTQIGKHWSVVIEKR